MSESYPFPNVRRVLTGHTKDGKSVCLEDKAIEPYRWRGGDSLFTGIYRHDEFPADNKVDYEDVIAKEENKHSLASPNGSVLWAVDFAPGKNAPFHRTISLDYAIMIKGSLTIGLDDGVKIALHEGDIVIQRGTAHSWHNTTDQWARILFVIIGSEKVKIGDQVLEGNM